MCFEIFSKRSQIEYGCIFSNLGPENRSSHWAKAVIVDVPPSVVVPHDFHLDRKLGFGVGHEDLVECLNLSTITIGVGDVKTVDSLAIPENISFNRRGDSLAEQPINAKLNILRFSGAIDFNQIEELRL